MVSLHRNRTTQVSKPQVFSYHTIASSDKVLRHRFLLCSPSSLGPCILLLSFPSVYYRHVPQCLTLLQIPSSIIFANHYFEDLEVIILELLITPDSLFFCFWFMRQGLTVYLWLVLVSW